MQFPKATRFPEKPPDTIPPPGAYDVPVHSPQQSYKRAGMLDRANRFGQTADPNKPDTFGLYAEGVPAPDKENQKPRQRTASAAGGAADRERHKQQLEELRARLTAAHEKELAKLRAKVDKLDEARQEHRKEREETAKEADKLKSENRHLTSKLARASALQAKYESTLPSLQAKLSSLTTQHAASSAKKDAELSTLRTALSRTEEERDEAREEAEEWEERARTERRGREDAALAAGELTAALRAEARDARVEELHAARLRAARLARRVEDREAVIASLGEYARGLEERLAHAAGERDEGEWREWRLREAWRAERELLVGPGREEKEWRQRARADAREMLGLREDVALLEREGEAEREWDGVRGEWERRREKAWREEKRRMERDFEVVEGELDLAVNDEIPRLESLLSVSELALSTARDDLATSSAQIAQLEADLSALEARRADEAERYEGELEEQRRLVGEAKKEAEKERVEKRRVVGILAQTRASEAALKEEVESLNNEVTHLTPLLAANDALQQTIDHLARLNAASEAEAQELIAHNSELAGHANQNQKIRHVAMIREELAESRRKHLATLSQLSTAHTRLSALEDELNSYRAVSSTATPSFTLAASTLAPSAPPTAARSRVSRPQMADALSASAAPPAPVATPAPTFARAPAPAPAPPRLVVVPAHDTPAAPQPPESTVSFARSTSALPPSLALAADAPLLPAGLARSAGPAGAGAGAGPGARAALGVRGRRKSTSVKMEGRMSVSELFM
ncbi:hypothetical protein JCM10450v2_004579 [Rhodotorula kratochvilovae]